MTSIVICEKPSQARDLRAALGDGYGRILPARGHLVQLEAPDDVNPAWATWGFEVLKPERFYRPTDKGLDAGGRKFLKDIREALKRASRVIIATDADREGTLIGGELIDFLNFRGEVQRAYFTAQDPASLKKAFAALKPWSEVVNEYRAGQARQQADQVYNLTLTRAATVALRAEGAKGVLGVGRVKTPTLAIVCRRENEIRDFVPEDYYEVVARAATAAGDVDLRHAPTGDERIMDAALADRIRAAADGHAGPLAVKREKKKAGPPKLLDLPMLQRKAGKWGWSAEKTLDVAQALYEEWKVITYPRAETKYLAESQVADVDRLAPVLGPLYGVDLSRPQVRKGKGGHFCDKCLEGTSHHAVVPNANTADQIARTAARLPGDARKLFDLIAKSYVAALMPDHAYEATAISLDVLADGAPRTFAARGRVTSDPGWRAVYGAEAGDVDESDEEGAAGALPPVPHGTAATLGPVDVDARKTKPPGYYTEGTLIQMMEEAWRFVDDAALQQRLKEAKGIGTPATRGEVIKGLKAQGLLEIRGKQIRPTRAGLDLHAGIEQAASRLNDPGVTAVWEARLDAVQLGRLTAEQVVDEIASEAKWAMDRIRAARGRVVVTRAARGRGRATKGTAAGRPTSNGAGKPTDKMLGLAKKIAAERGVDLPNGVETSFDACKAFLDGQLGGAGKGGAAKGRRGGLKRKRA